jgi:hypothetical protein
VADFIGTMNEVRGRRFRPEDVRVVDAAVASLRGRVQSAFLALLNFEWVIEREG